MAEIKITKKVVLEAIIEAAKNGAEFGEKVTAEDVITYATKTIEQLDAKNERAKAKAAEKKAAGDEVTEKIAEVLDGEYATIDEIVEKVDADVTRAKVAARLGKLIKEGVAVKAQVKTEDGRKVMAYAKADEVDAEADAE